MQVFLSGHSRHRSRGQSTLSSVTLRTGQSPGEFGNYSAYLGSQDTRPLGYTTYHSFVELNASGASARYIDSLRRTVYVHAHRPKGLQRAVRVELLQTHD